MQSRDIAIAGCGIAGLAAALLLERQGHRVTLYERFAEPRPIGSGLMIQPTGLAVLGALGLAELVVSRGAPIDALLGLNTEGERVLEASYADLRLPHAFGLGVHRASLFDSLFEAVRSSSVELRTGREVRGSRMDGKRRTLVFSDGRQSPAFDLVVDGLGVGSTLVPPSDGELPFGALWATVQWPDTGSFNYRLLEQRYDRADRMVGLLPIGEGRAAFFWSLQTVKYQAWRARGMSAFRDEVRALWPACEPVVSQLKTAEQLTFARYAHRTSPVGAGYRIAHIGDSWHAASPQLGQGANMALLDAWALAKAVEEAEAIEPALARYMEMRRSHVRLYQWLTWGFTPPFQSDSLWPALFRDLIMAPASRIPPGPALKAQLVAGLTGARLGDLGLELPDYSRLASASSTSSRACADPQS